MSLTTRRRAVCDQCGTQEEAEQLGDLQRKGWQTAILLPLGASADYATKSTTDFCPLCAFRVSAVKGTG